MPCAGREYSARWISLGSDSASAGLACCLSQYCITMAMLAAPHASFSCCTKGTSSQRPAGSAANSTPQRHSNTMILFGVLRSMKPDLTDGDNDKNQRGNGQDNQDQVPVAEAAGGKISLRLAGACGNLRELSII